MSQSSFDLSNLNGSNGFTINGINGNDNSGYSVSGAGDVNGDGIDDLIIGSNGASPAGRDRTGESYVVFGNSSGFASSFNLSDLNGSNGFVINGARNVDFSGRSVSSAGDLNGDGISDLIIGAPDADPNGNPEDGESYVVFGRSNGFTSTLELASLDGSNGFVLKGGDGAEGGGSATSAGDVNGDGIDDLIIGNREGNGSTGSAYTGESYVVFGNTNGFASSLNLSDLDGSNGFVIKGIDNNDRAGRSVSSAGDVNGDGIDDLIIGAHAADPNGNSSAGESYVVFGSSTSFGSSLNLSDLDGSNGFVINGIDSNDTAGRSVSSAGDVNGDGIDDLIIGAPATNTTRTGESYVVFGHSNGFGSVLSLSDLDGSNGFVINGIDASDLSGISVSAAGDVNGDGIDDLIIGAPDADPNGNSSGESYVVFGHASGFGSALNLSDLDGSNGYVVNGIDGGDRSGQAVSAAGDINGDGVDDLIIGAPYADPNGGSSGESYVLFGSSNVTPELDLNSSNGAVSGFTILGADGAEGRGAGDVNGDGIDDLIIGDLRGNSDAGQSYVVFGDANGFGSVLNLSDLDGSNGFIINGIDADDQSGYSVSSAGDVNGDGIDDLIIGARSADPYGSESGESYVIFGNSSGFSSSLNLADLNGSNGFIINGIDASDYSGDAVSSAGDINGDGIGDLIIGARRADPNGSSSGETYVIFGNSSGFSSSLNLSDLNGSNGFVINGIDAEDWSGSAVSNAGDVNGDGIDDLLIGARLANPNGSNSGESYVVFGNASGFASTLNLSTLNGSNGFILNGINSEDRVGGYSLSNAGDVNGDGLDDIIIGAHRADPNGSNSGESYVVFGRSGTFSSTLDLSSLNGSNGFVINGIDAFDNAGRSVSAAGDVNGDGLDDLIIGAPFADPNGKSSAGESYVVFGSSNGFNSSLNLSDLDGSNGFTINGVNNFDAAGREVSNAGDINNDGFDDLIISANNGTRYVVLGHDSIGATGTLELSNLGSSGVDGIDFSTTFTGGSILVVDSELSLIDSNSATLAGATITITNFTDGMAEVLSATTDGTSIMANYADGTLTLSGADTVANYQQVLRTITYSNSAPTGTGRTIEFIVDDGSTQFNTSEVATTTLTFDLPPTAVDKTLTTNEDTPIVIATSDLGYSDGDGDALDHITITALPTDGTLYLDADNDDTFDMGEAVSQDAEISKADLDAGNLQFAPDPNENGNSYASFDFNVNDGDNDALADNTITFNVTSVNDPAVITGTTTGTVTEDNPTTTATGDLNATDIDSDTGFTAQTDTAGTYGSFSINTDGGWTYTLNNSDEDTNALFGGEQVSEMFTVTTDDGTEQTITINVIGANDAAVITGATTGAVTEDNPTTTATGDLNATDVDSTTGFTAQTDTAGTYGTFSIGTDGGWTYTLNNSDEDTNGLAEGEQGTDSFTVTTDDGTKQTVTITVTGANDAAVITGTTTGAVTEDAATMTATGDLNATDVDSTTGFTAQTDTAGTYGTFSVGTDGAWTYTLNNSDEDTNGLAEGEQDTEMFTVTTDDGTKQTVTVTITGTNDAAVITGTTTGAVTEDATTTTATGDLNATDVDSTTGFTAQANTAGTYGTFSINTDGGWTYTLDNSDEDTNGLVTGEQDTDSFTVTTDDGTKQTVTITITGASDAAVVTGTTTGTVTEDNVTTTAMGDLSATDVDSTTGFTAQNNTVGTYGTFSINTDGVWTYALNNSDEDTNALFNGEQATETFTVTTDDGTEQTITINIIGTNDAAVLSSADVELDETDTILNTGGTLTISDVDSSETFIAQSNSTGTHGSFSIDTNGTWTYIANSAFNELNVGDLVSDTFTVESADGTETTVKVTINGTNDAPVAAADTNSTDENTAITLNAITLLNNDSDIDQSDTLNIIAIDTSTTAGMVTDNGDGTFTYNPNGQFKHLALGESDTDSFSYTISDGNGGTDTETVTLTINGTGGAERIGTSQADQLIGSAFDDTLSGLTNNDSLYGGSGDDSLNGGDGTDILSGGFGHDVLIGGNHNDTLTGHYGRDSLYGGSGDDSLNGGDGTDILSGGFGHDILIGGNHDDSLTGYYGRDSLYGGSGNDTLNGGDGTDILSGGFGHDLLIGGNHNDTLTGYYGQDTLYGGNGDDVLVGGIANDQLVGGNGADRFQFAGIASQLGVDAIVDFGTADVLQLSRATFGLTGAIGASIVASEFATVGSAAAAQSSGALITYNSNDGSLYFNANGSATGFGSGGQFAQLSNTFNLTASDIELIA